MVFIYKNVKISSARFRIHNRLNRFKFLFTSLHKAGHSAPDSCVCISAQLEGDERSLPTLVGWLGLRFTTVVNPQFDVVFTSSYEISLSCVATRPALRQEALQ